MKTFEYKAFDESGKSVKGLVEANNVKEVRETLAARGQLAEWVHPVSGGKSISSARRAIIYRELAELLSAGLTLVKALDVMIDAPGKAEGKTALAGIRDSVKEGKKLAEAFADSTSSISSFEKAIIEAGERTATLEVMLGRLADFLEEQGKVKERIHSALIYPSIVFTVGVCLAVVMLGVLIPKIREIIDSGGMTTPWLTKIMIGVGSFFFRWFWLVLVAGAAAYAAFRSRLKSDQEFALKYDKFLFRLPMVGGGYEILVNQRVARTMSILLEGGVSLVDSLLLAGKASGSVWVAETSAVAAEKIRHGDSLTEAIKHVPPLSHLLGEWINIGETSGGLDRLMFSAGERYRLRWEQYVTRGLGLIEPALILLVGGFVLIITLSVLLPVLSLSRVAGG